MERYSKAIAAGVGGAAAGAGMGAVMLPEGSPWYAYVIMTLVMALAPAVVTAISRPNAD